MKAVRHKENVPDMTAHSVSERVSASGIGFTWIPSPLQLGRHWWTLTRAFWPLQSLHGGCFLRTLVQLFFFPFSNQNPKWTQTQGEETNQQTNKQKKHPVDFNGTTSLQLSDSDVLSFFFPPHPLKPTAMFILRLFKQLPLCVCGCSVTAESKSTTATITPRIFQHLERFMLFYGITWEDRDRSRLYGDYENTARRRLA